MFTVIALCPSPKPTHTVSFYQYRSAFIRTNNWTDETPSYSRCYRRQRCFRHCRHCHRTYGSMEEHPLELLKTTIYARCIGLKPKEKAINLKSNLIHKISNNFQFHRIKYNFTLAECVCASYVCITCLVSTTIVYYSFSDLLSVVHRTTYMAFTMPCHLRQRFVWFVLFTFFFVLFFRFVSIEFYEI